MTERSASKREAAGSGRFKAALEALEEFDWIGTAIQIGVAVFVLVTFVRCALP